VTDERTPTRLDVSTPNVARMYDFYLGGKDNYAADRAAAEKVLAVAPQTALLARENRAFLGRLVTLLARDLGIHQFIDIGAGLPTRANVHEVAEHAAPGTKVVYVDNDPVVLTHSRALLSGHDNAITIAGDLRRPDEILATPALRELIDLGRPVAVLLIAVLHCLTDDERPAEVVAWLRDALPSGSHLAISHVTASDENDVAWQGVQAYQQASTAMVLRSREHILGFFDGFELLEPGLVAPTQWRPDDHAAAVAGLNVPTWLLCGVGRKA
jgi:O-methyltransferase involved in polyketide biosynthesis